MIQFTFTPQIEDYMQFQKFRVKLTKMVPIYYVYCVGMFAFGVYQTVQTKQIYFLCATLLLVLLFGISLFYTQKTMPKKRILQAVKKDNSLLAAQEVTVTDSALEINTLPNEKECAVCAVYPLSMLRAVFETQDAFNIMIPGIDAVLLPKREMEQKIIDALHVRFEKLPVYSYIK